MLLLERLKKRERFILYLTFTLAVGSLIYNFIFEPVIEKYLRLNQEIIKGEIKLQKYLHLLSQKAKIENEFNKFSEAAKTKVSDQEQMASILNEIEDLSRRSSVHITQIKPQITRNFGTYKEFPVEIRAEAKIEDIAQFIYNLQNSPQLLRAKKILLYARSTVPDTLEAIILIIKTSIP